MSRTRTACGPGRPLLALLVALTLATPTGTHAFVGVTSWAGELYGRWVAHSLTDAGTQTP